MAHAYTRYLGDLSGGQVLGRITQKSLGLSSKEGLAFFSFPGVPSPNRFKQLYRSRMNSIELTKEERQELLDEAVQAFEANIEVSGTDTNSSFCSPCRVLNAGAPFSGSKLIAVRKGCFNSTRLRLPAT